MGKEGMKNPQYTSGNEGREGDSGFEGEEQPKIKVQHARVPHAELVFKELNVINQSGPVAALVFPV